MRNNIDDNISTLLASHLFVWINLPKQFNYLAAYQLVKQIYYSIFTMFSGDICCGQSNTKSLYPPYGMDCNNKQQESKIIGNLCNLLLYFRLHLFLYLPKSCNKQFTSPFKKIVFLLNFLFFVTLSKDRITITLVKCHSSLFAKLGGLCPRQFLNHLLPVKNQS